MAKFPKGPGKFEASQSNCTTSKWKDLLAASIKWENWTMCSEDYLPFGMASFHVQHFGCIHIWWISLTYQHSPTLTYTNNIKWPGLPGVVNKSLPLAELFCAFVQPTFLFAYLSDATGNSRTRRCVTKSSTSCTSSLGAWRLLRNAKGEFLTSAMGLVEGYLAILAFSLVVGKWSNHNSGMLHPEC